MAIDALKPTTDAISATETADYWDLRTRIDTNYQIIMGVKDFPFYTSSVVFLQEDLKNPAGVPIKNFVPVDDVDFERNYLIHYVIIRLTTLFMHEDFYATGSNLRIYYQDVSSNVYQEIDIQPALINATEVTYQLNQIWGPTAANNVISRAQLFENAPRTCCATFNAPWTSDPDFAYCGSVTVTLVYSKLYIGDV